MTNQEKYAQQMQDAGVCDARGAALCATVKELLMAAEYIMASGNDQIVLCERGIRTYETATRNTLDLSVIPVLHERTHLPVVIDPSPATGGARYVPARAAAPSGETRTRFRVSSMRFVSRSSIQA